MMPLHHVERGQQLTDQRQDRPQQRALIGRGLTVPFIGRAPPMRYWKQTRNQAAVLRRKIERQKCVIRRRWRRLNRSASARADQSASSTALWLERLEFIRLRRRQRLRRHALDLFTASRVDDDSTENNLHVAAG